MSSIKGASLSKSFPSGADGDSVKIDFTNSSGAADSIYYLTHGCMKLDGQINAAVKK